MPIVKCIKCGRFMRRISTFMSIIQAYLVTYRCSKCEV